MMHCVPAFLTGQKGNSGGRDQDSRVLKINAQPSQSSRNKSARYALQFFQESEDEIRQRKEEAFLPLTPALNDLEIAADNYFSADVEFPKRPPWNYEMSPQLLELQEQRYFTEYVSNLEKECKNISYFELNLETWRQLWRVLEMSDVILFIVDIRYSALMFPPSLYHYVTDTLKKDFILVLNKVDLAPPPLVVAWKNYFIEKFPSLHVIMFTSFPGYNLRSNPQKKSGLKVCRLKGRMRMAAEGAQKVLDVCKQIVENEVDLTSWQEKIIEEMKEECEIEKVNVAEYINAKSSAEDRYTEHEKFQDGVLTIGCVGHPNVGKSSLLNALMGKKVVSVSRTPGHTKHFQTIFLTPNVKLCDCPGLVFPSKTPKNLQVLMGSFPIAQLREPYSSIRYLAEHMDLIKLLALQHPEDDEEWSAIDVCNAWAQKRGFFTARTARLDSYRAANHLLRMTLEGKICLCLQPPEYSQKKEFWEKHPDISMVKWIQALERFEDNNEPDENFSSEEEADSEAGQESGSESPGSVDEDNGSDSGNDSSIKPGPSNLNKFAALDSTE
ncbi:Large subunit GTPase 1 homolog [Gryllus bimaculatus]|nr:Large subunit GTPase 1 homolog [Gryllus bimaculatus]